MLPITHLLMFVPVCVFLGLFAVAAAVNVIAGKTARSPKPAFHPPAPLPSAEIIYFKPRKTSVPSARSVGVRHRAMPR